MKRSNKLSPEVRERAVRLVQEQRRVAYAKAQRPASFSA